MSFDNVGSKFEYVRHGSDWRLLEQNVDIVQELMTHQGHWGGIHAVYNLYNATNFTELKQFAQDKKLSVLWQNLFQPDYLDPFLHGADVADLAAKEIEKFYSLGLASDADRQFFDSALTKYRGTTHTNTDIAELFKKHIAEIETQYHPAMNIIFKERLPAVHCKINFIFKLLVYFIVKGQVTYVL
jgi:hypothetical protein